jgi:hypothetical protein
MACRPVKDSGQYGMDIDSVLFREYVAAFFVAWAVGAILGFVWAWFRSLLGDGD